MTNPAGFPRTALVTGAGRRLGSAIAQRVATAGARVAVHYHESVAGAEATCEAIRAAGGLAEPFQADLSDADAARSMLDAATKWLGNLELLVLSAANFERAPFEQLDDGAWQRALDLNLTASFTLSQHAAPLLKQSAGNIVFITCSSTLRPFRNYLPYVVSKAGALQLMRTLALELAPEVRVNAVAPGLVLAPQATSPEEAQRLASRVPLQRWGTPEDVAEAVAYLAKARYVTGQQLVVDGGQTIG